MGSSLQLWKLETPSGRWQRKTFVFVCSKLSYIYISLYASCLIVIILYTGPAFLLVLGSLFLCCTIQPSTSGPAFA